MFCRQFVTRTVALMTGVVLGFAVLIGAATSSHAFTTGSAAITVSITGRGTVSVGTQAAAPAACTSPATTPQNSTYTGCGEVDGSSHDSCISDGAGGSVCTTQVTATAPAGWSFAGWSGDCSGTTTTCNLDTSETTCDQEFKPPCSTELEPHDITAAFTDVRAPTTTFSSAPTSNSIVYSNSASQTFGWSTDEDDEATQFTCQRDLAGPSACSSGITWSSISDGLHQFCVRGTDASGLVGAVTCRSWDQETNPSASILTNPPATTGTREATFTYSSNKASHPSDGSTLSYLCKLDTASFTTCPASGTSYSQLQNGDHTFSVEAVFHGAFDAAGTTHTSAAATYTWTQADTTAPNVTITHAPSGVVIDSSAAQSIEWTGDDAADGQTFRCAFDTATFTACSSPLDLSDLTDGVHVLKIEGTNNLGNTGPAMTVTWDQQIPPSVVIDNGPAGGSTVPARSATFSFHSAKAGVAFQCRLDSAHYRACSGVGTDSLTKLVAGQHTFWVRALFTSALDAAKHYGTPATRTWTVLTKPACTVTPVSAKAVKGKVSVRVRCTQPGSAVVGGTVTETITHKNAKPTTKHTKLATKTVRVVTNTAKTVQLSLGSAWSALQHGTKETAVFTIEAQNAAGSSSAHSTRVTLRF